MGSYPSSDWMLPGFCIEHELNSPTLNKGEKVLMLKVWFGPDHVRHLYK